MLAALVDHLGVLAATGPGIGPPLPAPAKIGPVGEWFLPALIIVLSLGIDATKAGDAAKRDRFAAAMTYAGALGMISVYQWAPAIQSWTGDSWSWRVSGSAFSFVMHVVFVLVLVGHRSVKVQRQAAWLSSRAGVGSAPAVAAASPAGRPAASGGGSVGKVNTKLHLWAVATACSYVLARGDAAVVPERIGAFLTAVSGAIGQWIVARLGG